MAHPLDEILARMHAAGDKTAIVEEDGTRISYARLLDRVAAEEQRLARAGIGPGSSVLMRGDFGIAGITGLLALLRRRAIVTPLAPTSAEKETEFATAAEAAFILDSPSGRITPGPGRSRGDIFDVLRISGHPGLVIFSSGTTGTAKGAVHDLDRLMQRFSRPGKDFVTLAFLLFDHIAGIDTLFYTLSNASTLVCTGDRSPETVARLIAAERVEVLPTAPSFLNLLLLSGAASRHDLSSLKVVTYGAEAMPQSVLDRLPAIFPKARIIQKYGTSEIGALRSRSDGPGSLWLSLGTEGEDWRQCPDGLLEIRSSTAMLGYLNAPSPFTEDGWYRTGDRIRRRDDGMICILGRASDMINVGGQKVFPAEVENALCALDDVAEASVFGKPHPILGAAVHARVRMTNTDLQPVAARSRIRRALQGKLEAHKIPQRIDVTSESLTTARFKQRRQPV